MRIVRDDTEGKREFKHFTGSVWTQRTSKAVDGKLEPVFVYFAPKSRTYWHEHPGGQALYILSGRGRTGSSDGEVHELRAGDVVLVNGGERHWHGAAHDSFMSHLALNLKLTPDPSQDTDWKEAVEDEDYDRELTPWSPLIGVKKRT